MKPIVLFVAILSFFACKRCMSKDDLETQLKKVMTNHLYKSINNDTSRARYDVKSVTFYEEQNFYDCEFKVRVTAKNYDTTGMMTAKITKDFSKVMRKS